MKLFKSISVFIMLLGTTAVCTAATHQSHLHAAVSSAVSRGGHSEHSEHGWGHGWGHHGHGYGGFYVGWSVPWYSPWYYGYGYPYGFYVDTAAPVAPTEYVEMNPPAPTADTPAAGEAAPGVWYYCKNPDGYYPYVKNCPDGWQEVPAQPPKQP